MDAVGLCTPRVTVLEIGSGTGNLAQTILNASQKELDYLGIERDDLLIDLSASIADVMGAVISFAQGDAVRPADFERKPSDFWEICLLATIQMTRSLAVIR